VQTVGPERLCQLKIPMAPLGIKTATFQLLPQSLKQLHHHVTQLNTVHTVEFWTENSSYSSIPDVLFE
jgi:hypothetical protein